MKNLADLFVVYKQFSQKEEDTDVKEIPSKFKNYLSALDRVRNKHIPKEQVEIIAQPPIEIGPGVHNGTDSTEKSKNNTNPTNTVPKQPSDTEEFPDYYAKTITTPDKERKYRTISVSKNSTLNKNAKHAYDYFIEKGLSKAAAAGIVGNLYHENLANPSQTVNDSRGTTALGIAGFNSKGELPYLQAWCKQNGLDETEFDAQLAYLTHVVNSKRVNLSDPNLTPEKASFIFGRDFEKFAGRDGRGYRNYDDPEHKKRRDTALKIFNSYGQSKS